MRSCAEFSAATNRIGTLESAVKPRTITPSQVTNFIFLTSRIPKIPTIVGHAPAGDDTQSFTHQFRAMLNTAGFVAPTNSDVNGITRMPFQGNLIRPIGETSEWKHVSLLTGPDSLTQLPKVSYEASRGG